MNPGTNEAPPPHAVLIQMGTAHWVSRILFVAAQLGIADRLAQGAKSAEELAGPTGTLPAVLYRFMRALGNLGVLAEDPSHKFSLTPLGEALKAGAPGAARAAILTLGSDWVNKGFE